MGKQNKPLDKCKKCRHSIKKLGTSQARNGRKNDLMCKYNLTPYTQCKFKKK